MQIQTDRFYEKAEAAIRNERLQAALKVATTHFVLARKSAALEFSDMDALRDRARSLKEQTIERLDEYLELLEDNVCRNGGIVHWARDSREACRTVLDIAARKNARTVVKSKSMTSEEIGLNEALEEARVKAIETDLGEYIVQLAGEKPSHIIAPAIHKSKNDVSELFSEKLGIQRYEGIEELARVARKELREKFCSAELGISGVNFAIAQTGTIVIVENEGNARLSTTLPETHIAIMGIEKIIPRLEDLDVFLKVLIRSATGQKLSSYISLINGPRRTYDSDGPKEFHLIILDNGRSHILRDKEMRESLYCLRCGACLNVCPVYQKVGGHTYGWVYSGPIGAIITPQLVGFNKASTLPYASTLCGACRDVCPVKINIPHLLLKLRSDIAKKRKVALIEKAMIKLWALLMSNEKRYAFATRLGRWAQGLFMKTKRGGPSLAIDERDRMIERIAVPPFSRWTKNRDLPPISKKSFRERWKSLKNK